MAIHPLSNFLVSRFSLSPFIQSNNFQQFSTIFRDGVWQYFLNQCAENLHIVLSMSPSGQTLRNYCNNFPGLVGSTTIDWMHSWPEEALYSVANMFLSNEKTIPIPMAYRPQIVDHLVHVHQSLNRYSMRFLQYLNRAVYVTPSHYLDYLASYIKLLGNFFLLLFREFLV